MISKAEYEDFVYVLLGDVEGLFQFWVGCPKTKARLANCTKIESLGYFCKKFFGSVTNGGFVSL